VGLAQEVVSVGEGDVVRLYFLIIMCRLSPRICGSPTLIKVTLFGYFGGS
jgi:hypothetical protein